MLQGLALVKVGGMQVHIDWILLTYIKYAYFISGSKVHKKSNITSKHPNRYFFRPKIGKVGLIFF